MMLVFGLFLLMVGTFSFQLNTRSIRRRTAIALARNFEASGDDVEMAFLREIAEAQQENRCGKRFLSRLRARRAARMMAIVRRDLGKSP
ncbi:hypothetical protein ACRYCC_18555 [Actinomadura scrupuli]|uniref:hypothetical protein n=1 Tax=Actinomadura scrupuli TaxID=559629 RepID=UPI003D974A13